MQQRHTPGMPTREAGEGETDREPDDFAAPATQRHSIGDELAVGLPRCLGFLVEDGSMRLEHFARHAKREHEPHDGPDLRV